ncbi:hypothetical protein GCM10022197_13770 [Microlunatus spumicola]|uniref:Uncharacterized protein n=1 Tax=Microlunatus spumicola TaxID=81499 RepID=A0ABP6X248_9ACTN
MLRADPAGPGRGAELTGLAQVEQRAGDQQQEEQEHETSEEREEGSAVGGPLGVLGGGVESGPAGSVWWHASTMSRSGLPHIGRQATPRVRLLTYAGYAPGRMWAGRRGARFDVQA